MLLAVAAVAIVAFLVTTWLLTIASQAKPGTDRASARLDAVRTGLAAGAGAGAAVGLMLAFRRQHHQEIATVLTDLDATERRITELYTKAVEQLGSDKAPVRLGGLYALERLAQDAPAHRQTIVNVMCAYLRMPFSPTAPTSKPAPDDAKDAGKPAARSETRIVTNGDIWQQERQVRLTAQRILAAHLCDDTIRGQQPADPLSTRFWSGIRLDLTGATLIDFDLKDGVMADAYFGGATFTGGVGFEQVTFTGDARFDGATFTGNANFNQGTFTGRALFDGATFTGHALFGGTTFAGTAVFSRTTVTEGAVFNSASFKDGALFGRTIFKGIALFGEVTFTGNAVFDGATFNGAAVFSDATFNGAAVFSGATFNDAARFGGVTFTEIVRFDGTIFNSVVLFDGATFTEIVRFDGATFTGAADPVSFERSRVLSPDARHIWPMGWRLAQTDSGEHTVIRASGGTRP